MTDVSEVDYDKAKRCGFGIRSRGGSCGAEEEMRRLAVLLAVACARIGLTGAQVCTGACLSAKLSDDERVTLELKDNLRLPDAYAGDAVRQACAQ